MSGALCMLAVVSALVGGCSSASMAGWTTEADGDSGLGCPDEIELRLIVRDSAPEGGSGWFLHEAIVTDGSALFSKDDPLHKPLTRQAAAQLGARADASPVWVYVSDHVPPCRMDVRGYWAIASAEGEPWVRVAAELKGECPNLRQEKSLLALQARAAPNECLFDSSTTLATSTAPAPELAGVGFPEPFSSAMDPEGCLVGSCRLNWQIKGTRTSTGFAVLELTVSRATSELDKSDQSWSLTDYYSLFVMAGTEEPARSWPDATGYRGLFYDRHGIRALVTDESGVLTTYGPPDEIESPPEELAKTRWYIPRDKDYVIRSLWPTKRP